VGEADVALPCGLEGYYARKIRKMRKEGQASKGKKERLGDLLEIHRD